MSIAMLKRKTNEKYKTASNNQPSFSINGTSRKELAGTDFIMLHNAPSTMSSAAILRQYHTPQYNHVKVMKHQDGTHSNHLEERKRSMVYQSSNKTFATKCNTSGTNRNACCTVKDVSTMSSSELLQRRAFKKKQSTNGIVK
jgi:hypothetical protein